MRTPVTWTRNDESELAAKQRRVQRAFLRLDERRAARRRERERDESGSVLFEVQGAKLRIDSLLR